MKNLLYTEVETRVKMLNKTMVDFYKFAGYSRQSNNNYKTQGYIPIKYANEVSNFLGISNDDVLKGNILGAKSLGDRTFITPSVVPFVGKSSSTVPSYYTYENCELISISSIKNTSNVYAVELDSLEMTPDYKIGDIIFCKYGDVLPSDNLVVHYHYNGQSGIRICKMDENSTSVVLTPLNLEQHKIIFIPKERRKDLKLAKVVGLFRSEP